jgi:uncharacterized protein DUF6711
MAMISVGAVGGSLTAITSPKSFTVTINDVDSDNTQRNAKGDLQRDRIAVKRSMSLDFPPLTNAQISTLLTAVSSVFFDVNYPDPMSGGNITKTCYVGNRTSPLFNFNTGLWESLSMDFIEK